MRIKIKSPGDRYKKLVVKAWLGDHSTLYDKTAKEQEVYRFRLFRTQSSPGDSFEYPNAEYIKNACTRCDHLQYPKNTRLKLVVL